MHPGETIGSGAPSTCPECKTTVEPKVMRSAAGHYVGTMCKCGPYTRESGYYPTAEAAQKALDLGVYSR